ncbi:MAG: phosphatidylserine decarboxylase [Bdellovibrionales bacterium]|nr:phosphatidylserine decarboxylase [Bdellovibrionales bacterium]
MSFSSLLKEKAMDLVMPILPKEDLSHWAGRLMHLALPGPLREGSIATFAKAYGINIEEAEKPLSEYRSIGDFFTRKLKPGARPQAEGFTHPCDSKIAEAGPITAGSLIQAKGIHYRSSDLLGDGARAERYEQGAFITYYLCPTDYHRVHIPEAAKAVWRNHIPGAFWPVNAWSIAKIDGLYSINERVAIEFETTHGDRFCMVLVAATNVGNIKIDFDREVSTEPRGSGRQPKACEYQPPISIVKGGEVGLFAMGSTVVMLLEKRLVDRIGLDAAKLSSFSGRSVQVSQVIMS